MCSTVLAYIVCLRVFVKQDTRDGLGAGKLHGRQMFVCKNGFALFVPIGAVIPEKDFDESHVYTRSRRTSEREEQIRKDELLAKSLSYDANSSGKLPFKIHLKQMVSTHEVRAGSLLSLWVYFLNKEYSRTPNRCTHETISLHY